MKVATLIIGIDGWEQYTLPLIKSIQRYESDCQLVVIDNASSEPYPEAKFVHRTERLCYAAAINRAASFVTDADWLIVLSNDVLCTGRFNALLRNLPKRAIYGPKMATAARYQYIEGWCVIAPWLVWKKLGGWDENYVVSSWEDVDFSYMALREGNGPVQVEAPFIHLDQRQRFALPEFAGTHDRNRHYFEKKHGFTR